jgi:hypothetical protein
MSSCNYDFGQEFTGTHGNIKIYEFKCTNDELVSKVDILLLNNPQFYDNVIEDYGWVFIKFPNTKDRLGFEISGKSQISLIEAGKEGEVHKYNRDLSQEERDYYIKIFETNFINRLDSIIPKIETILKSPFILESNNIDTTESPYYMFAYDTLLKYPLPLEFKKIDKAYFEDLVFIYSKQKDENKKFMINQHYDIFRINNEYSGYIKDSIYITKYYRDIGASKKLNPIFNISSWKEFTHKKDMKKRIDLYKTYRIEKVKKKYGETDVYEPYLIERWMNKPLK